MSTIKLAIATLRKNKGVTQSELAEYLGVTFQSVSKWENGATFPDIQLLPKIAEFFEVSVDEVLGVTQAFNNNYEPRKTSSNEHWSRKIEYLKQTRLDFWNDDYLEFLVSKVWNIDHPVKVVDYGCGYGFLGMKLLPLLPAGSTYTGVDISEVLIKEANLIFSDSKYQVEFIRSDISNFNASQKYDIAICQAVLRHVQTPKEFLNRMTDSVVENGLVICIEVNRAFEVAGMLVEGYAYEPWREIDQLSKLWNVELENEGRDHSIGLKIPSYMKKIGLKNIDVRINDKTSFINPSDELSKYKESMESLRIAKGWNDPESSSREATTELFKNRGLTKNDADVFMASNRMLRDYVEQHEDSISIIRTLGMVISYGYK